ncbi:MAG: hypothetical protein ACRC26_01640 [Bacteroidales bacterium]
MIADIIILVINLFLMLINEIIVWVINILPTDLFKDINLTFPTELVAYVNWVFPFTEAVALLTAWAVCAAAFAFIRMIMKVVHLQ